VYDTLIKDDTEIEDDTRIVYDTEVEEDEVCRRGYINDSKRLRGALDIVCIDSNGY
jgi:hypothetical protein